jgi:O-antigen/teichoic acid export membrane protein
VSVELARDSMLSVIVHLAPRVANVILFIFIGRLMGPDQAGIFALATTYLIILTTLMRGLDDLVIRQVSRQTHQAGGYLVTFLGLRMALSMLLYLTMFVLLTHLTAYSDVKRQMVLIIGLSVFPDSLAYVAQAVLLGQRYFIPPAAAMALGTIFKITAGSIAAANGGSLLTIAWFWCLGSLLAMVVQLLVVFRLVGGLHWAKGLDWLPMLREAAPFFMITVLTTIDSQADILMLSVFRSDAELGWYNAATTVAFSLTMIAQAYRMSVYPLMARYALQAPEKLHRLYERSLRYLGILSLPMTAGIILLATPIVALIYGSQFGPTAHVLQIITFVTAFLFLNVPSARMMLVKDRQNWSMLFLLLSVVVNLGVNLWLVPGYGTIGAAWARFCSTLLYFGLTYFYVERYFIHSNLVRLLARPAAATLIMSGVVWLLRDQPVWLPVLAGVFVFAAALWSLGGVTAEDRSLIQQLLPGWGRRAGSNRLIR